MRAWRGVRPGHLAVLLSLACILAWAAAGAAVAQADPIPLEDCPPVVAQYTGADETVAELRILRVEQVISCLALRSRLDRLHEDLKADGPLAVKLDGLHDDLVVLHGDNAAAEAVPARTVALSSADRGEFEANAAALHADFWFAMGAVIGLAVMWMFFRVWRPKS